MKVERLDHLVLTVWSIAETSRFYETVLGMTAVEFEPGRWAMHFGDQKINLHEGGREFLPQAGRPTPGSGDLCFITAMPIAEVAAHLSACGVAIEQGPVARTGALGAMESVYIRDPDRNLIEIAHYAA